MLHSRVASYLKANELGERALFQLINPDATFDFAEAFGRNDAATQRVWNAEQKDTHYRVEKHWTEVLRKQERARQLRNDIAMLQSSLSSAESYLSHERTNYKYSNEYFCSRYRLNECERLVRRIQNELSSKRSQPLPRDEGRSLRWLFFLTMPECFQVLLTLSLTAQQMLVPRPWRVRCRGPDGLEEVNIIAPLPVQKGDCLTNFYNAHQV
jgi:hypothetical protein